MNEIYERLDKWAAKNNMQFKVEVEERFGERFTYLWMADAVDGYLGAECVCISEGRPTWLGYRFRLRKNERFLDRFMRLDEHEDTDGE